MIELRRLAPGDEALVSRAASLFDGPPLPTALSDFFAKPDHHLILALSDGTPVGFVSGVELTHPDKGTEMYLNEVAVDAGQRRRGIGTTLVNALEELARERGCHAMWVLTDVDNEAAIRTFQGAGADESSGHLMLTWHLD